MKHRFYFRMSVENTEQLAYLAFHMPVERKSKNMVECEPGHTAVAVLHEWDPECIAGGCEIA
jgi:hypothetical protein